MEITAVSCRNSKVVELKEYMDSTKLQDLRDLAAALKIIYKTACERHRLAESHIFNTNDPEMMKYSLAELKKMKEDALVEWHAARTRARQYALKGDSYTCIYYPKPATANIEYNHSDSWYRFVDKEMK